MATTPNLGLNLPAKEDKNWHVPTNANWSELDTLIGKITDIGNYDATNRASLTKMLGLETGLGNKSIIKALKDGEEVAGLLANLRNNDAWASRTLSEATNLVDAINILDGVYYEEIDLEATNITITPIGQGVTVGASGLVTGTPIGVGYLRWNKARSAFGFQAAGQGGEGSEVNVTKNETNLLIPGQGGVGGIYINVVFASLPLTDTVFTVTATCRVVELANNVGVWGTDKLLVLQDDNGYHYSILPSAEYADVIKTVVVVNEPSSTPNVPLVETYEISGFVSASGSVKVWYALEDAQDTTTSAFKAFLLSNILNEFVISEIPVAVKNNIYVSENGSAEGTGSIVDPVDTVAVALTLVPDGEAANIILGAGTFDVDGLEFENVPLIGSGMDATILEGDFDIVVSSTGAAGLTNLMVEGNVDVYANVGLDSVFMSEGTITIKSASSARARSLYGFNQTVTDPCIVIEDGGELLGIDGRLVNLGGIVVDSAGVLKLVSFECLNSMDGAVPCIRSTDGTAWLSNVFAQWILDNPSTGDGITIDLDNGATGDADGNRLNNVFTKGDVDCGTAYALYEGVHFVGEGTLSQIGSLVGTNLHTHTHVSFEDLEITGNLDVSGGDLQLQVEDVLPATPSDEPKEGTIRILKDGGVYEIAVFVDNGWRRATLS